MIFEWNKTKYLQTIINQELTNKSQILILVERKVEAHLISELVGNFASAYSIKQNYNQFNISTYFGSSFQNCVKFDKQIENFKNKLAPGCAELDWNADPFINVAKLITSEELLSYQVSDSFADILYNFKTWKSQVLISTIFDEDMVSLPNTSIILYREQSFLKVPFAPSVLLNEAKILCIQNNKREETLKKIKRIDLLIKGKYHLPKGGMIEHNKLNYVINESNKR